MTISRTVSGTAKTVERMRYPASSDDDRIDQNIIRVAKLALPAHRSLFMFDMTTMLVCWSSRMPLKSQVPALSVVSLAVLVMIAGPSFLPAQTIEERSTVVTNSFYSASGNWAQVSNTNCVVWNSFPKDGESVTWSGGVFERKAHGKGTVQWFTNGVPTTSYVGEMKGGLADGHGISKGPVAEFEGEWSRGSLISTNGTIRYPNGNWYKGEIINGLKTGRGEELMTGGQRYVGQFKDDRFHGKGELILPNGDRITGEWRDSKLEGIGTYQIKSGGSFKVRQTEVGIERL